MPARDGRVILGHLLNENGFIDSEMTITRFAPDRFYLLSAATAQLYDMDQLRWRLAPGEQVGIADVTDEYGVLVLAGPRARDVLATCTAADLGNTAFPWRAASEIEIAGAKNVRALRINYVGELGWELHTPMAEMPKVFAALMSAGERHGMRLFGTYAMNSLRMEKAYRSWGAELTNEVTMVAADMERFVAFTKEFIGKEATLRAKAGTPPLKLAYMAVESVDHDCYGNEPVYDGERLVGITTSGAYGHAADRSLAFAYIDPSLARPSKKFEILMMGRWSSARILSEPAWDPGNLRLRA
jgi:dimethylglycine dehydrogenase